MIGWIADCGLKTFPEFLSSTLISDCGLRIESPFLIS